MSDTPLHIPSLIQRGKFTDYRLGVWGNSFTWYAPRSWDRIKHVVIHHSVTNPTNDTKNDVDYIAELHRQRGWDGIGYHFVITADGMVWYVGDVGMQRANVADKNDIVIGVCLVGDFTKTNPTDEQILSAHDLAKFFIEEMPQLTNCNDWENGLKGHQDLQATQCPGSSWDNVSGGSIKWRITTRTPYTPVPAPEPIVDWEKRYSELKTQTDKKIAEMEAQKETDTATIKELEGKIADCEKDCQEKIDELTQNLKDAQNENPKIRTIVDFTFGEIVDVIVDRVKNRLGIKKDDK